MKERDHLEYVGVDGRNILKFAIKEREGRNWTGYVWFRISISDGLV
jgi:hypothetical protein